MDMIRDMVPLTIAGVMIRSLLGVGTAAVSTIWSAPVVVDSNGIKATFDW